MVNKNYMKFTSELIKQYRPQIAVGKRVSDLTTCMTSLPTKHLCAIW